MQKTRDTWKRGVVGGLWAGFALVLCPGNGQAAEARAPVPTPFARIGRATSRPEYHAGRFRAFGWETSTAFCGMRDANLEGAPCVGKDASWWLTYDRDALYVTCLVALAPQGEHFLAGTAAENDPAIFRGDHLVIQVALQPDVGQAGVPYLRVALNPNGAVWAETVEALPGQNHPLDTGRLVYGNYVGSGHIPGHWWYARLRIPLEMLGVDSLDGKTARTHLAWVTEPHYLSWGGVKAGDWARMPTVVFDPKPRTSLRLNGSGPPLLLPSGHLNLDLSSRIMAGSSDEPTRFRLTARNVANGRTTWERTWEDAGESGRTIGFRAVENVKPVNGAENRLVVRAEHSLGGDAHLLFHNELPYRPGDERVAAALDEWKRLHAYEPDAGADYDYVYAPYVNKLEARVNTGLELGIYSSDNRARAERIVAADRLVVRVVDAGGARVADGAGAVADGAGRAVVAFDPPLPGGAYTVKMELYGGERLVDSTEMELVRERFEWEHNTLGKDRVIIPPWTEVGRGGRRGAAGAGQSALTCWGRTYVLQDTGLPAAMISQGEDVLAGGGMRLEGVIDGTAVVAAGTAPPGSPWSPAGNSRRSSPGTRWRPTPVRSRAGISSSNPPPGSPPR